MSDIARHKNSDPLLNVHEAAVYLGISEGTLRRMVWSRQISFTRIGRAIKFRRTNLDAFIESKTFEPAA